jgi:RNA polymerase sigma-70 factor (ECF subfamily)
MDRPVSQRSQPADDELRRLAEPLLGRAAAYAFALLGNREDAEDAIQEALLKAYRGLARHDRSQGFKAWWFAIVRNCCRDLHRSRSRRAPTVAVDAADSPGGDQSAWEEAERRDMLRSSIAQLSPAHREIIQLRYFGDCSYQEIATALGIPIGTVMSRLHAARRALAAICEREPR